MKPGFIIYNDYCEKLSLLSDEELGKLIRFIFEYEKTKIIPKMERDLLMVFNFIKVDLDNGTENYNKTCERNRNNGKKGGRPVNNPDKPKKPSGLLKTHLNPKKPIIIKIKNKLKDNIKDNLIKDNYISEETIQEISNKYNVPISFVKSKLEDIELWEGEKPGRMKGRNWKLTLMNWVKRDALKIKLDYGKQNSEVSI